MGGLAFGRLQAQQTLKDLVQRDSLTGVMARGALEEPLRQIAGNGGYESSIVVNKVKESKETAFGFNAASGEDG